MDKRLENKRLLGINGLGRIGKLSLWHQLLFRHFDGVVVNIGREAGNSIEDIVQLLESDSTYGNLSRFIYGAAASHRRFEVLDEENGLLNYDGFLVQLLRTERNPALIGWKNYGVRIVVDCTGKYTDPTVPPDKDGGSLRGHLESGADVVLLSAPFKIRDKTKKMPDDSFMTVYGVNHLDMDIHRHRVLSSASCTTTGLAHMLYPILQKEETSNILTASMSTVHAATNSQKVLDALPGAKASDLRKQRSALNNIIVSSTGAAKALEAIMPQIEEIGFMADAVRIPTNTVSLIILNVTFSSEITEKGEAVINKTFIDNVYKEAAEGPQKGMLVFSQRQNVSADMIGYPAAVVIEGHETHTRTGFISLPEALMTSVGVATGKDLNLPVTHAKIFGWYDNEYGSYVNTMGKLIEYVDNNLQ
ncbi:MAG: glyceraldehyde 3-phosphate dehydrogenase NAD-binding domain-containing protein [Bacteroidales bacterium]